MKKLIEQRREFNKVFGIETGESPRVITEGEYMLEYNMMLEELTEYKVANDAYNVTEIADSVGDMMYLVMSMAAKHGLLDCLGEVVEEIHKSNMTKVGPDGKVLKSLAGKIIKPDTYVSPNLHRIIVNHVSKFESQTKLL